MIRRFARVSRLAFALAKSDFRTRYASSFMGSFWNLVLPFMTAITTVIVFSVLMRGRLGQEFIDLPFVLYVFLPYVFWMLFSDIVNRSCTVLREYAYLINKLSFPVQVLPWIPALGAVVNQIILAGIVIILFHYFEIQPLFSMVALFPLWISVLLGALGIGYIVSATAVYIPDVAQVVPVCVNILFWLTPFLYPVVVVTANAPDWVSVLIIEINPFTTVAQVAREASFIEGFALWHSLTEIFVSSIVLFFVGFALFTRLKRGFADVL